MPIFRYRELVLDYTEYGQGTEVVVFFHGFGRTVTDAEVFLPLLRPGQRLVSVHLFAHGNSIFPTERIEREPLDQEEWAVCFSALCDHLGVKRLHLAGYSMGGRVAMVTATHCADRLDSLILLAPDGFKRNIIYLFASGTQAGRALYRWLIGRPEILFRVAGWLHSLGWLSDKLFRFVHVHLDSREKRQLVYDAWLIYKKMFPSQSLLASQVNAGAFRFAMVFGEHDRIIRPALGERFQRRLRKRHLHTVRLGHRLLAEETVSYLETNGLWPSGGSDQ